MATKSGSRYVPERGDIVWLTFDPRVGHEQSGRRPAVILTPSSYNGSSGLAIAAPVTSQVKGYPFEVLVPAGLRITGAILVDQLKSIDWRARDARRIASLPEATLNQALKRAGLLLTPSR